MGGGSGGAVVRGGVDVGVHPEGVIQSGVEEAVGDKDPQWMVWRLREATTQELLRGCREVQG